MVSRLLVIVFLLQLIPCVKSQNYTYLGCFLDANDRDLPSASEDPRNSVSFCYALCKGKGFKYFGLQASTWCNCGNDYGTYGPLPSTSCTFSCAGNRLEKCGGGWENSVYSILNPNVTTPPVLVPTPDPTPVPKTASWSGQYQYVGCYIDTRNRVMHELAYMTVATIEWCYDYCTKKSYDYFGVEATNSCFCGNKTDYETYGPSIHCNQACRDDASQICGGDWALSVYQPTYSYIGCFADYNHDRDLPDENNKTLNSIQSCRDFCSQTGYQYFGLQAGTWCNCGNSYGKHGTANNCTYVCPVGAPADKCGGVYSNSVYSIGYLPTPVPTPSPPTPRPATAVPTAVPTTSVPTAIPTTSVPTAVPTTSVPTAIPTTSVPTAVPTTSVPTAIPTTSVPTAIPTTSVPTAVPTTSVPTAIPTTAVATLPTLLPATSQPLTQQPIPKLTMTPVVVTVTNQIKSPTSSGLFAVEETKRETIQVTNNVATVVSFLSISGTGAGSSSRLHVLSSFGCVVEDIDLEEEQKLDFEFHPTGLSLTFGDSTRGYINGALIMNPLLMTAAAALLIMVAGTIRCFTGLSWERCFGSLRTPGVLYIPFLFLLQGTSLVASRALFYPKGSISSGILGGIILMICLSSPMLLYLKVLRRISAKSVQMPDPRLVASSGVQLEGTKAIVYRFVFGSSVWISRERDSKFVEKYGNVFESYKSGKTWFTIYEPLTILALSLLSAWQPGADEVFCDVRNALICLLFFIFMATVLFVRPYSAPLDNLLSSAVAIFVFLAVLFMTVRLWSHQSENGTLAKVSAWFLLASAIIVLIKCVWDAATYFCDVCLLARRQVARKELFKNSQNILFNNTESLNLSNSFSPLTGCKVYKDTALVGEDSLGTGSRSASLQNGSPTFRIKNPLLENSLLAESEDDRSSQKAEDIMKYLTNGYVGCRPLLLDSELLDAVAEPSYSHF